MSIVITPPPAIQKGSAGSFETWQQVLDNGSVLDKANTIDGGGFIFSIDNTSSFKVGTTTFIDGLLSLSELQGFCGIGDVGTNNNGTNILVYDATAQINANAINGYTFNGGRISAQSDLTLMDGNAGIFYDGSVFGYNLTTNTFSFSTSGNGDLSVQDAISGNPTLNNDGNGGFTITDKTTSIDTLLLLNDGSFRIKDVVNDVVTMYTNGDGGFAIYDKVTSNTTIFTAGDGDFSVSDKTTGIVTFQTNRGGAINTKDAVTTDTIFAVDEFGLQTLSQDGTRNLSDLWLLGEYTAAAVVVPDAYITVKVGAFQCKIPVETV